VEELVVEARFSSFCHILGRRFAARCKRKFSAQGERAPPFSSSFRGEADRSLPVKGKSRGRSSSSRSLAIGSAMKRNGPRSLSLSVTWGHVINDRLQSKPAGISSSFDLPVSVRNPTIVFLCREEGNVAHATCCNSCSRHVEPVSLHFSHSLALSEPEISPPRVYSPRRVQLRKLLRRGSIRGGVIGRVILSPDTRGACDFFFLVSNSKTESASVARAHTRLDFDALRKHGNCKFYERPEEASRAPLAMAQPNASRLKCSLRFPARRSRVGRKDIAVGAEHKVHDDICREVGANLCPYPRRRATAILSSYKQTPLRTRR